MTDHQVDTKIERMIHSARIAISVGADADYIADMLARAAHVPVSHAHNAVAAAVLMNEWFGPPERD